VSTQLERSLDGSSKMSFDLVPGPGRHLVNYGGRYFMVERQREHQTFAMNSGEPWEKVVLTSFGRDVTVFDDLLEEARNINMKQEEGATIVYTCWGTEWRPFGHPRRKRRLDSVVLDEGIKENIVEDLNEWRSSAHWYHDRGIPYRRGYLLHGPPGSGKTSFIVALAGELDYNICILSLSDEGMTDDRLAQALSVVPQRSIVLLEDIDAAFGSRVSGSNIGGSGGGRSNLTFSGLLNTLDGVASSEERILFMTTNYLERLDPALMRPGRVDVVHKLDSASMYQAKQLFEGFYTAGMISMQRLSNPEGEDSNETESMKVSIEDEVEGNLVVAPLINGIDGEKLDQLSNTFAERIYTMNGSPSMAELQGHLMGYKDDPELAVNELHLLSEVLEERLHRVSMQEEEARRLERMNGFGQYMERPSRPNKGVGTGRRVSSTDVDKMAFNPQPGWEEAVGLK
jgi:DNA polymerase III delta prime subunit